MAREFSDSEFLSANEKQSRAAGLGAVPEGRNALCALYQKAL